MTNSLVIRIGIELAGAVFFIGFVAGCLFVDYFITRPSLLALNTVIRDFQNEVNRKTAENNSLIERIAALHRNTGQQNH